MKMPQPAISPKIPADLDVLLLCGGKGTRLRSVVSDRPKVLAEVGGRPFLDMLIDNLSAMGFGRIILSVGYLKDHIKDRYARTAGIFFAEEEWPLGTGGGVKNAAPLVMADTVLVMNGDSYLTGGINLAAFHAFHEEKGADVTLMLARPRDEKDYGVVLLDADGKIAGFNEKANHVGEHFLSAGVYLMNKAVLAGMPSGAFSLETDFFPRLVGSAFYGFPVDGRVIDIGTPERYLAAQEVFYS